MLAILQYVTRDFWTFAMVAILLAIVLEGLAEVVGAFRGNRQ